MTVRLADLAHARAGDKGDTLSIAVVAYDKAALPRILAALTPERIAAHFNQLQPSAVTLHPLPQLGAVNIVIAGALRGGVTRSLALDAHGKCLASVLLAMEFNPEDRP